MKKTKNSKGITLIALVITIVVLLILAMVSINLIMNGGIITHAENATSSYKIEEEKERIALAYTEYKMAKLSNPSATLQVEGASNVSGDENNGWTVELDNNTYTIDKQGTITYVEAGEEDDDEIVIAAEKDLDIAAYYYSTMYNQNQPQIISAQGYYDDENNDKMSDINTSLGAYIGNSDFNIPVTSFSQQIPTEGNIEATITHFDGTEEEITLITTDNKVWIYESEKNAPLDNMNNINISFRPYAIYDSNIYEYRDSTEYHLLRFDSGRTVVPFYKLDMLGKIIEFPYNCQGIIGCQNLETEEVEPMYNDINNVNMVIVNFSDGSNKVYIQESLFDLSSYKGKYYFYSSQKVPILYAEGSFVINMPESSLKVQISSVIVEENGVATKYNVTDSTMIVQTTST